MNSQLKAEIILKYGTQFEFAKRMKLNEQIISRVILNRQDLSLSEKNAGLKL